jgi:hypothetical protein
VSGWGLSQTYERWPPATWGLVAFTVPPNFANGTIAVVSGDVLGMLTPIQTPTLLSNAWIDVTSPGVGLTPGQNLLGVYSSGGVQLAVTPDQTAAWAGTGNIPAAALSSQVIVQPPYFWTLLLAVAATSAPTFRAAGPAASTALGPSVGSPTVPVPYQRVLAAQTTLPASFVPTQSGVVRNATLVGFT